MQNFHMIFHYHFLINKNVYPDKKDDFKAEENDQSSALGSIGLKPKIVH